MSRTSDLYDLQKVDLELTSQRTLLAEVEGRLAGNPDLEDLRARLQAEQEQVAALQSEQRDLDLRAREARDRVGATEVKLYGGGTSDARELSHLQASLAQDQAVLSRDEDQLMGVLARMETAQGTARSVQEQLEEWQTSWDRERTDLTAQQHEVQTLIAALEARRAVVAARLRRDDQAVYSTLAIRLGGRPVARVERGICQECRIALPTVVIQRARRGEELANCSSCQRILFVG